MSQIETTKLVQYVALGAPEDNISVSKLVMYAVLVPGEGGTDDTPRQGHVHTQILRRS